MNTIELDPKYFCDIILADTNYGRFTYLQSWDERSNMGKAMPLNSIQHTIFDKTPNCLSWGYGSATNYDIVDQINWPYAMSLIEDLPDSPENHPGFIEIHPDIITMLKKHHIELKIQTMTIGDPEKFLFNYLRILAHGSPEDLLLFKLSI